MERPDFSRVNIGENKEKTTKKLIVIGALLLVACLIIFFIVTRDPSGYTVQGNLKSSEIDLNSKIAGNIEEIKVEEGQYVKKGDILIVIDSESIEAKRLQAEGAVAAATATYEKACNGARSQEVVQAKAAADLYEKTYKRVKALYDEGAVSESDCDQAYAQYLAAQQTYSMAMEGARSEDVTAAHALVLQAQGALAEVDSYLEDCEIKATMDGIVSSVNVEVGELVSTGMPLVSLSNRTEYWVEVNVSETSLYMVEQGGKADITFAAYPDVKLTGTVISVAQKPSFATKRATNNNDDFDILSYTVKIKLPETDKILYPGMTVNATFEEK